MCTKCNLRANYYYYKVVILLVYHQLLWQGVGKGHQQLSPILMKIINLSKPNSAFHLQGGFFDWSALKMTKC